MKKKRRAWRAWIILLLAAIAALLIIGTSESFETCIDEHQEEDTNYLTAKSPSIIALTVRRSELDVFCAGEFTDQNEGAITALATLIIAIFTATLSSATSRMWESALDQGEAMERYINHADRSATAMQDVADAVAQQVETGKRIIAQQDHFGRLQLRAYLSVVVGGATYQERAKGLRFNARPLVVNNGQTPALKTLHSVRVGIFPAPLPPNFELPPLPAPIIGESIIAQHQNRNLGAALEHDVPDEEVAAIMRAENQGLYVWGYITYEDVFGEEHRTDFCQTITWLQDGTIYGFYTPGRNRAT